MPRLVHLYSVFLASPSDVEQERSCVATAIAEWNARHGRDRSTYFELLRWETSVSAGFGHDGQEVINEQVGDEYDVLIAIFWAKLGSATPRAASGTLEEYGRALERFKRSEAVEIAFFFKDVPVDFRNIDLEQVTAVKTFEKEVQAAGALTKTFRDQEGLKLEIGLLLDRIARRKPPADRTIEGKAQSGLGEQVSSASEVKSPSIDDDVGIFDAVEQLQEHATSATAFLAGFHTQLEALTDVTEQVTKQYKEIRKVRPLETSEAKAGLQKVADAMDTFSGFLELNNAEYQESTVLVANSIRDIIRVSHDFILPLDSLPFSSIPFYDQVNSISSSMSSSLAELDQMVDIITGLPRTTSGFNKARRRIIQNLEVYKMSTLDSKALLDLAVTEFSELITASTVSAQGPS